ncbi:unnamed protein product [Symbiodinium sp. KB8]|nr:unnamed protein product [Symbiodinium sp. KB8]
MHELPHRRELQEAQALPCCLTIQRSPTSAVMAVPKLCAIAVLLASAVAVRQIAKTDAEGTHQALVREREHVAQNTTKPKHTWRRSCCMCETNWIGICKSGTGTQTRNCGSKCDLDWDGAKCWHVHHDEAGNDNCHV